MFPLTSILVIVCHLITSVYSETVLDQYSNQISNGFSKIRHNAQNNFINAGYTAHNSLNEIHDNTHNNFNKLLYKSGFSDVEDRQGLNNLANLLRRIRGSLRTPNVRQILGDFLSRPGVARALFLGSTGTVFSAGVVGYAWLNDRIIANIESIRGVCEQLNTIANCASPQGTCDQTPATIATTPSNPVAVSCGLGSRDSSNNPYPILFPITAAAATAIPVISGVTDGLALNAGGTALLVPSIAAGVGNTATSAALSIADFNRFRGDVLQAIDILDQKLRDIVAISATTCP